MNKHIASLIIGLIVFQNCTRPSKEHSENGLFYQSELREASKEIPFEIKELHCQANANRIIINLAINRLTNDLSLSLSDWELETMEGARSLPINQGNAQPGNISKTELIFEPTNSLNLFRQTGLKGMLLPSYQLTYKGNAVADLRMPETIYESYKKDKKEPGIFFLSMKDDFKDKELAHLKANLGLEKNGVEIHEQEVLIDGVNLVLNAYSFNDTLFIKLKLVNHSLFPVKMKPGAITLQMGSKNLSSVVKHETDEVAIPRSQRGYVEEKYPLPNLNTNQFLINISSINFMAQKPVPLFFTEHLSLKRSQ